uniref:ADP-ribosylation factor-like protein 6-interacting protein 6 n=1 Tax=Sinocyclocheilus rhinocerous TaxID=307959 RepID=A0A673H4B9_9TELE
MLRSARDKDVQSLDVYSDDEDNTPLAGRRNMLGEINAASLESSEIRRATPGRQPVLQRFWKHTHLWPARIVSVLCSVVIVSFIAVLISFLYIVLKDLRAERITTEDGSEVRLLGFWCILVLSSVAGVLCCSFSWTLTYFDSFEPGMFPPTPLSSARLNLWVSASKDLRYGLALRFRMHRADVSASGSRYGSICYDAFLLVTPKASFHERAAKHLIFLQNKKLHPRLSVCLTKLTLKARSHQGR